MSGNAQTQLHDAVLKALRAAVKPVPVWDHVPQRDPNDRQYPYLVVGDGDQDEWDTDTEYGMDHRVEVHVFSRQTGRQEARLLQKKLYDALHNVDLNLGVGARLVLLLYEASTSPLLDPDGVTYHAVTRFRALTEEA